MQYKNLLLSSLLFTLLIPLQILGENGRISYFSDTPTLTDPGACGKDYIYEYYIALNYKQFDTDKSYYCGKCVKIVYNNKYAVGGINDKCWNCDNHALDVSPKIFKYLEINMEKVGILQADWFIVSCDLYGKTGECLNSNCDEIDQPKVTTTKATTTTTITITGTTSAKENTSSTGATNANEITNSAITTTVAITSKTNTITSTPSPKSKTSFIIIGSIILGCIIAILIGGLSTFMFIKKRKSKRYHDSDLNSNEEFRNGSIIKVVLNNNNSNSNGTNTEINNNHEDTKNEINNKSKHSTVGINNNRNVVTNDITNTNNNNKEVEAEINNSSKDTDTENNINSNNVETEINTNNISISDQNNIDQDITNQRISNQNNLNQNILNGLNQNNLNQNILNSLNQNNLNQNILNSLNQNSLNQNMINSNNFNFNTLVGRNVFIYNFQNSGDFVMSSIPLFNNNNNNNNNSNNQNSDSTQRVPPSYEENEPLPEYSYVDKSMEKQQFM